MLTELSPVRMDLSVERVTGLEPVTFSMARRRSGQLNYTRENLVYYTEFTSRLPSPLLLDPTLISIYDIIPPSLRENRIVNRKEIVTMIDPLTNDPNPRLACEIAERAILLFSGQCPEKIERTSIRTDCFLLYGYKGQGEWAVTVILSRNETNQALVTIHSIASWRYATYTFSYSADADGKFAIQLNA